MPRLSAIVIMGVAAACATGGAALAATASETGYGPPPVSTPLPPGGFSTVITSVTISPAGGTVGPFTVDGCTVTTTVPAGAFAMSVQITLTAPDLAAIPPQHHRVVVCGEGITVSVNGVKFAGTFLKPITTTFGSPNITAASDVTIWNGTSFVTDPNSTDTAGGASVSFDSDPAFAVETPISTPPAPVPGATVPVTGKPVLGEGILAGALILGGAGGIAASRRRRRVRASSAQE
jgi:hypothetical protein